MMQDLYLIKQFADEVGYYSESAMRAKINTGIWINGREYVKAPDQHIFIIRSGVERWICAEKPKLPASMKL